MLPAFVTIRLNAKQIVSHNQGYSYSVYETFTECEVCVRKIGEGLQQNLGGYMCLVVARVELVPVN